MNQKIKRAVKVGGVMIGGGFPVSVQTMTKTPSADVSGIIKEINSLTEAGCDIVRCGIPDEAAADAISDIKAETSIPVVADIHFDHRLALRSISAGADKIRINPGNIGGWDKVRDVLSAAGEANIPIRIGLNSGSLPPKYLQKPNGPDAEDFLHCVQEYTSFFEKHGFNDIVLSVKSSDVRLTIDSYRMLYEHLDYPLHVGVTESGFGTEGLIRSALGIGLLLYEGIGDTIRVSLTDTPHAEVEAGKEILKSLELRDSSLVLISCPTCARREIDVAPLARSIKKKLSSVEKKITFAVMGCPVNGPGEAKLADYGVAGGKKFTVFFKRGRQIKRVTLKDLEKELELFCGEILDEA